MVEAGGVLIRVRGVIVWASIGLALLGGAAAARAEVSKLHVIEYDF